MRQKTGAAEGAYSNLKGKGKFDNVVESCIHRENQRWVGVAGMMDIIKAK